MSINRTGVATLAPTGAIMQFGAASAPTGWLLCDGSAVSRTTYATLFAAISTTYGTGDGSTTFNVPDLRGRVAVGSGTGTATGAAAKTLGSTPTSGKGGEETHTLTTAEMPAHVHALDFTHSDAAYGWGVVGGGAGWILVGGKNTLSAGGGGAHNIMGPYTVVNYIIKT